MSSMEILSKILEIISWPLVVIILGLIFYSPIKSLLNRIKGIKGAGYGFDTEPGANQQEKDKLFNSEELKIGSIKKGLNLYSDETRKFFQDVILLETEVNKIKDDKERADALKDYAEALYVILHFERIYTNIFGSQITLLQHLNSSFNETLESVKYFYDYAAKQHPEIAKYPYSDYIRFLHSRSLVHIKDSTIQISWLGRDFLKFMVQTGLSDSKIY